MTSKISITAFVLSLISFLGLASFMNGIIGSLLDILIAIGAIVLGIIGAKTTHGTEDKTGFVFSVIAIVMGSLSVIIKLIGLILLRSVFSSLS